MTRWSLVVAAALVLSAPAGSQDDPRQKSLKVVTKHNGKKLELKGSVDMPDGTILTFTMSTETETMMFHKVKCRIAPIVTAAIRTDSIEVKGKKFTHDIDVPQGFYRYSLQYMKFAQRDEKVAQTLKPAYQDWESSFNLILVDAKTLVKSLNAEREKMKDWVADFRTLAAKVTSFVESKGDAKAWKPIETELERQEKRIQNGREGSYYPCTMVVLSEGLMKMRACSPMADNMNFPPGSAEADHLALGTGDIPSGVNADWNADLVRAFAARCGRTLDRERMIAPLRLAKNRWDTYLAAMRAGADDPTLDTHKHLWTLAVDAVKENAKVVEDELPNDKKKRSPEEKVIADWCTKSAETMDKLDEFLAKRRAAVSIEEKTELDEKRIKEYEQAFDALNTDLRMVPGT